MNSIRPVWAEIDIDAIENNIRSIKEIVNDKQIIAVVKADAYGHGAIDIAEVAIRSGAERLAVAVINEAMELREANIDKPIMILGYTPLGFSEEIIKYNIEQTVFTLEYAKELSDFALKNNTKAKIHIAIDTGMGRIGFLPNEQSVDEIEKISKLKGIEIVGLFTHFSTADEEDKEYTLTQIEKYKGIVDKLDEKGINIGIKHVSNSAAIIDLEDYYFDAVRPGIILYGYYPSNEVKKEKIKIRPALTLKSNIVHLKTVDEGTYISYGRSYVTDSKKIIATLPIGYADGYTRLLNGKAMVIINGKLAPVVGKICMDQCMVDVTDVGEVSVGDEVILLGRSGDIKNDADDIADMLGTINYEIICMIGRRVPRVYKHKGKVIKTRNYL